MKVDINCTKGKLQIIRAENPESFSLELTERRQFATNGMASRGETDNICNKSAPISDKKSNK